MAQNNMNVSELSALIESIVTKVLSNSFGEKLATWSANQARNSLYLSRETGNRDWGNAGEVLNDVKQIGQLVQNWPKKGTGDKDFGGKLAGVAGIASAYESGDALSGALSGAALGPWGIAAGLFAGLLSPGIDRWQRPKFKKAKQAFDKLFSMDRGERDEYYLPDSFYFRAGSQGNRKITVHVGNDQFDDHIRESLTNNYSSQLQRGLVF